MSPESSTVYWRILMPERNNYVGIARADHLLFEKWNPPERPQDPCRTDNPP
jgi:hypothetical protein